MTLARYQFSVLDDAGDVIPGATITVRREITGAPLATLYSDRAGATPIGNPFAADGEGFAAFHVAGGAYRIDAVSGLFTRTWRYVGIGLASESDSLLTGITWNFSTVTTDSDPGAGLVRFNNSTLASVTSIFFDNLSALAGDVSAWLTSLDDRGTSTDRGILTLQTADGSAVLIARVSGSVVDGTGYRKVTVTPITASGAFTDASIITVQFNSSAIDGIMPGITFNFDSSTAMADPGTGDFRLNNATLAGVTAAAIDDLSGVVGNPDVSAAVLAWDDSTNTLNRGYLTIKKISAPQNIAVYKITGTSTDNAGWTQLALTHVSSAGSFTNGDACILEFAASGDRGNLDVAIGFVLDGIGATLTTGIKGDLVVPFACTITEWTLLADQSGSIVVDIWKDTFANYPPTIADTITAAAKPTISASTKGQSSSIGTWTGAGAIAAGDTLRFNVDSVTSIQRVTLILKVTKA